MKKWLFLLAAMAIVASFVGVLYSPGIRRGVARSGLSSEAGWQRMALPGELSRAHAFLKNDCAACHTGGKGVEPSTCIACHADDASLLQRQPTSFHANVSSCRECHIEHRGYAHRPTEMDHAALAKIGFRSLKPEGFRDAKDEGSQIDLMDWIGQHRAAGRGTADHSTLTPEEAVLDCATCHSTKDRHQKLFGQDCAQCHGTTKWTIPEFRHPSPTSKACAQCHQAPPSHYMMHFQMVSAKVARQPTAKVNQCYRCHQTTSWNDIKGVGWYKHH